MAEDSKSFRHLMITRAITELHLIPYIFINRHAYWEFDLEGSTLKFAKNYIRGLAKYWEFRKFDSSESLPMSAVDLVSPVVVMIGSNLYESICRILNFLTYHITLYTIFIFEKWDSDVKKAIEEFEDKNPTVILKEVFSIDTCKAFQVRDM